MAWTDFMSTQFVQDVSGNPNWQEPYFFGHDPVTGLVVCAVVGLIAYLILTEEARS